MESGIIELVLSLVTGAAGGNLAGALLKKFSLGTLWNSVVGIIGGGLGAQILAVFGLVSGGGDIGSIISAVGSGAVGGGVLMSIIGLIRNAMGGKSAA
ncbi:MAG: hypothetical protein AAGC71_16105 [Pseudomonadota bacterium]